MPINDIYPDSTSTDLMQQLLPYLYDSQENTMLNPDDWMAQYGSYLTPFDTQPDLTVLERLNLVNKDSRDKSMETISDIQSGIGMSGFGGSYLGDVAATARDKLSLELQSNYANALQETRSAQQMWQTDLYQSLGVLAGMEAFNTPPGVELITDESQINAMFDNYYEETTPNQFAIGDNTTTCPCPNGGYSIMCCDENITTDLSSSWDSVTGPQGLDDPNLPDINDPDVSFEDVAAWYGSMNPLSGSGAYGAFDADFMALIGQASWGEEAIENLADMYSDQSNYQDCIAGASSVEEMQACYDNTVSDFSEAMSEATAGIEIGEICSPSSPYYDYGLCQQWTSDYEEEVTDDSDYDPQDEVDEGDIGDDYYEDDYVYDDDDIDEGDYS